MKIIIIIKKEQQILQRITSIPLLKPFRYSLRCYTKRKPQVFHPGEAESRMECLLGR